MANNTRNRMKTAACAVFLCLMASGAGAIGFDVNPSRLNYTTLSPGDSKALAVTLYLRGEKDLMCAISADDSLNGWVNAGVNPTLLAPYSGKTMQLNLTVPVNASPGEYSGNLYFSIAEQPDEQGMSLSLGFLIPVHVYFRVTAGKGVAYRLMGVGIVGGINKTLLINESNNGGSLLVVQHNVKTSKDGMVIKTTTYKNNILPFNSKTTELDLDTSSLPEGVYEVQLSITGMDVQANKTLQFTVTPEKSTTTTISEKTTTTQPAAEVRYDTSVLMYAIMAAVLLLAAAAYLLLRKR